MDMGKERRVILVQENLGNNPENFLDLENDHIRNIYKESLQKNLRSEELAKELRYSTKIRELQTNRYGEFSNNCFKQFPEEAFRWEVQLRNLTTNEAQKFYETVEVCDKNSVEAAWVLRTLNERHAMISKYFTLFETFAFLSSLSRPGAAARIIQAVPACDFAVFGLNMVYSTTRYVIDQNPAEWGRRMQRGNKLLFSRAVAGWMIAPRSAQDVERLMGEAKSQLEGTSSEEMAVKFIGKAKRVMKKLKEITEK